MSYSPRHVLLRAKACLTQSQGMSYSQPGHVLLTAEARPTRLSFPVARTRATKWAATIFLAKKHLRLSWILDRASAQYRRNTRCVLDVTISTGCIYPGPSGCTFHVFSKSISGRSIHPQKKQAHPYCTSSPCPLTPERSLHFGTEWQVSDIEKNSNSRLYTRSTYNATPDETSDQPAHKQRLHTDKYTTGHMNLECVENADVFVVFLSVFAFAFG